MHSRNSKMGELQGRTGKGSRGRFCWILRFPKSFSRCGKVVEGGEQRWRKVCRGRSSDQLVNIRPFLDMWDINPFF